MLQLGSDIKLFFEKNVAKTKIRIQSMKRNLPTQQKKMLLLKADDLARFLNENVLKNE